MNKLEKIKGDPTNELEEVKDIPEDTPVEEEKKERKFFSLFTFWKKIHSDDIEEDAIVSEEEAEGEEKKGISKYLNLRTGALVASVAVIAVAGYINIRFAAKPDETDMSGVKVSAEDIDSALAEKEGSAVDGDEDYFALSVINRQRVRDEAMEILLDLTNSDVTDAQAKADAYNEMTRMANEITNEANIESLVKAKGFSNCVAVVSRDDVNVIVESEGLTVNQVAQIKEIVYLECGVHPDNVKIIEKAGV
ncbi:MAG: SpoIIIAH-like family protein [Ruminococcaceae bacterium]|nr:SpoIIIAH-like family protein [Oscillospiraceae bacterium]